VNLSESEGSLFTEVDFETAWLIVLRDLPPLGKAMRVILAEIDEAPQ